MCVDFSVWPSRTVEKSGQLLCFPWMLKLGINAAGQAGLGHAGRRGRKEGDPAGVWLRSNPGDYYHWETHTHTSTGICCWRQSWLLWFPLVRGDNVLNYSVWWAEISQWTQDKWPFITLWALFKSSSMGVSVCVVHFSVSLNNHQEVRQAERMRGLGISAGWVWAQQREGLLPQV